MILPLVSIFSSFRSTTTSDASAVKAMFIYNFTKYFDWSNQNSKDEFVIAVYGNSEVTKYLREIAKRKDVNGKAILIREISSENEAAGASMIFLPEHSGHILQAITSNPKFKSMLIITEEPGSIKKGSHINLINVSGKMKFEMNESLLKNNGVLYSKEISSLAARLY